MVIVLIAAVLLIVWALFYGRRTPSLPGEVTIADDAVTYAASDGDTRSVAIGRLVAVDVITTDEGPFVDDVFWVLTPNDDDPLVIPSTAEGSSELLNRLGDLDGFDHLQVIVAMGSTDNAHFPCWRAGAADSA